MKRGMETQAHAKVVEDVEQGRKTDEVAEERRELWFVWKPIYAHSIPNDAPPAKHLQHS